METFLLPRTVNLYRPYGNFIMAKNIFSLLVAVISTAFALQAVRRGMTSRDKSKPKEALKEWESEGGSVAPASDRGSS